jgi:hypothetical protein
MHYYHLFLHSSSIINFVSFNKKKITKIDTKNKYINKRKKKKKREKLHDYSNKTELPIINKALIYLLAVKFYIYLNYT